MDAGDHVNTEEGMSTRLNIIIAKINFPPKTTTL